MRVALLPHGAAAARDHPALHLLRALHGHRGGGRRVSAVASAAASGVAVGTIGAAAGEQLLLLREGQGAAVEGGDEDARGLVQQEVLLDVVHVHRVAAAPQVRVPGPDQLQRFHLVADGLVGGDVVHGGLVQDEADLVARVGYDAQLRHLDVDVLPVRLRLR